MTPKFLPKTPHPTVLFPARPPSSVRVSHKDQFLCSFGKHYGNLSLSGSNLRVFLIKERKERRKLERWLIGLFELGPEEGDTCSFAFALEFSQG